MFEQRKLKKMLRYFRYHQSHSLDLLLETFEFNKYTYAIVGGFVKSVLTNKNPRDIDIIVDLTAREIKYVLKHYGLKFVKNSFGGFKVKATSEDTFNLEIDVWSLDSHYPFKNGFLEKDWKNIPKSAWISIDGATWLPSKSKLYIDNLKKTLKTKTIFLTIPLLDFYSSKYDIPSKYILVGKLIHYAEEERFLLSENCEKIVKTFFKKHEAESVLNFLKRNYDSDQFADDWENRLKFYIEKESQ